MRLIALLLVIAFARAGAQAKPPAKPPAQPPSQPPAQQPAQQPARPDSVTLRINGTELRTAVQIIQPYLDKAVIFSGASGGQQVSLETPVPVPRADVPKLLRGLLESQNYELVEDTATRTYRARPKEVPRPAPAIQQGQPTVGNQPSRPASTAMELFVIPLRHARASDVANTINALFGRNTQQTGNNGYNSPSNRSTLADELRANQVPMVEPPPTPLPGMPGPIGRTASLTGELTIVPDSRANSLLIRANRIDYELICAAVQQIDVRPPQALIEVLIVEARRDRSFALGLGASVDQVRLHNTGSASVGGAFSTGDAGLGDLTLKIMSAADNNLASTITAAAGRGDVKIVSRPVVLTANDEEAEVTVGSQRPFVQVSRSLPTDALVRDQVVQYKDVGTKLRVRPTISYDGTVQLSVTQEVSNATNETQFNAPVISTRTVKTDLLVKDGQTIALGGLTDKEHGVQSSGLPFISSIPYLGGLFGRRSQTTTETELFIFLTPRVIRTDEDAKRLTDPMKGRADTVRP